MQILKKEVKDAIIREGKKEFLAHGFKNSALRQIAGKAGISAGNLYKYFKSKDDLFMTVVQPAIDTIKKMADHEIVQMDSIQEEIIAMFIENYSEEIISAFLVHRDEFLLVLNYSEGSKHENVKNEITEYFIRHILDHFKAENIKMDDCDFKYIPEAYAVSTIEGFISILNKNDSKEIIAANLKMYFGFILSEFMVIIEKLRGVK
ncbi:MAG: TetR/AcrR family transcriptional regulator [Spirochaetes bacterium]|nr:TetR/AcrR family transcriptional regulator [Spirochaetota bacterium]